MSENKMQELIKENENLKKKLQIAKAWMDREVKQQIHKIAKRKVWSLTEETKKDFFNENIEELISGHISSFFWDILLLNAPKWTIEAITTSEINYYNLNKNPSIDGFSVISWYHKALDLFVENFIATNFRKYAKKQWQTILRKNDPLEKALNSVVNKRYIISIWRLYALIKIIREWWELYDYGRSFKNYLKKYSDIWDILLSDEFFTRFDPLIKSEILTSKRHSWSISKQETDLARDMLIWNFKDKNCILYKLLESQAVMF